MSANITPALVEWHRAKAAVALLTSQISDALRESYEAQTSNGGTYTDWLQLAYKMECGPSDDGYSEVMQYASHENDVEGYLAEHCQHTLRAHHLIQERKQAKKRLGIAKRRLSLIANQLAALAEQAT